MSSLRSNEGDFQDSKAELIQPSSIPGNPRSTHLETEQPILTRNVPVTQQYIQPRPIQPGMQGQPGQPIQVMRPGQGIEMAGPNMTSPTGQPIGMFRTGPNMPPGAMPGQMVPGQMMPGQMVHGQMMPGPMRPGMPYTNSPAFGGPGYNNQFGRPMMQNDNRFAADNRGLQNVQDTGPSNYETSQVCVGQCTGWMGTYMPCFCCCSNPYKTVPEGHSGIIMRFGKFYKLVGPGMHYLLPDLDTLEIIDKREKVVDMKHQSVVSKDNTSFTVDSVLYYRIVNTYKSKFAVSYLRAALEDLAVTTLRNAVGRMTIQQFLEQRDDLANQIEDEIQTVAASWGAKVLRVLVQDVYLPSEFRNTFSSGALAKKISEAQVITSKAEVEVAKLMKDAASALSTDAAFQIRYITALEAISKSSNPKMIFFPADFNDVGTTNTDLLSEMAEEMQSLVVKHR